MDTGLDRMELKTCEFPGCEIQFEPRHAGTKREKRFCSDLHRKRAHKLKLAPKVLARDPLPAVKTRELIQEMHERGYYVEKAVQKTDARHDIELPAFDGGRYLLGCVSDPHMCSKYQQLSHFKSFYRYCAQERGITTMLNSGDVLEGNGRLYRGQTYELFIHGADPQLEYAAEEYPHEPGVTTYAIGGSHDNSFFKSEGYDILAGLERLRPDFHYLGNGGAFVTLNGLEQCPIYLLHPDGGGAYARSYRLQKIIEQFAPEHKPKIILAGHLHFGIHLPAYRNVEGLHVPCFQSQTPYMKVKGLFPMIGGLIIELVTDEAGLVSIKTEWFPFYVPVEHDY